MLFFVSKFPTLSETFILNQVTGLIDLGVDVKIFSKFKDTRGKVHDEIQKYQLLDKTVFFEIPKNIIFRLTKGLFVFFKVLFRSPKMALKAVNFLKYKEEALFLDLLFATHIFLKNKESFDLIHSHFGQNGKLAVFLKDMGIFNKDIPLITSFYGHDISAYVDKHGKKTYDAVFEKCQLLIAISRYMEKKLILLGCPANKIFVHHLGVDSRSFKYIKKKTNNNSVAIITIARFVEKKGLEYSIKAFSEVVRSVKKKINYSIIGDGELRESIEKLITDLEMSGHVDLKGWQSGKEIRKTIENSDIFLLASVKSAKGDEEGTPTVILEAMSSGLPVVSTLHSGIPEQVQSGISGLLVPERNTKKLAEALVYLINNPEIRLKMGTMGRKIVEEKFDIKKLNKELFLAYQKIMKNF